MRWWLEKTNVKMASKTVMVLTILILNSLQTCYGARRVAQRRRDSTPDLYLPAPSAESLTAIAQAVGAAGFEDYTEGKTLVKRLIPPSNQPDSDIVEHLGVIGRANVDFPALPNIPNTGFNCKNVPTGYYADLETDCQVFHICDTSRKISFLCPNGTIFSQSHLICDWWFKVDCASAPALYESSVEYYTNEQKKSQRISHNLSKNHDLQQIGIDTNVRAESKRAPVSVPSTTERLLRHRQKLQSEIPTPTSKATARSYQALFEVNPTQRTQAATAFEKRRKNLVQLIANNFGTFPSRTTLSVYDSSTHKSSIPVYDHNSLREMQVAAETASFAQNQNRQFLQEYNSKNFRPYPVYTPNLTSNPAKTKSNPTLTTLYDIQAKQTPQFLEEATTKRQTLVPYTKSYVSTVNERHEPYTRPGVSLLRDFLEKEKNRTLSATEKIAEATARSEKFETKANSENKLTIETKDSFESVTKIPSTTIDDKTTETVSSGEENSNLSTQITTEQSYQERRERLMRKLNSDARDPAEPSQITVTEKYYGDQPNRPGLVVPSSLTPKTLHSLAIYYATALDNLSTTSSPEDTEDIETTTPAIDEYEPIDQGLPPLFSRQTITKYGNLFGHGSNNAELLDEMKLDPNSTYNELAEDLSVQMSQGPLATSPQIRELAQVFTHALSAYLQDPVQFRKVLSDIRPTHPSFSEMLTAVDDMSNTEPTTTVNEDDEEILGFSDDHKVKKSESFVRDSKALNIATDYPSTIEDITTIAPTTTTTEIPTTYSPTTPRSPFRCCGRISASYTTSTTPREYPSISNIFIQTGTVKANSFTNNQNENKPITDYTPFRHERIQNNNVISRFGKTVSVSDVTSSNDYTEVTASPTAWGANSYDSTLTPITNSHQMFESKKIRPTTGIAETTPTYFAETDSIELENEEELQRAHSQSFVSPNSNNIRQGKQLKDDKKVLKKPSEDLEVPTEVNIDTTTIQTTTITTPQTTPLHDLTEALTTLTPISGLFTSPESGKSANDFQWPTTYGNWQSTILDPITLNDGLSVTGPDQGGSDIKQQTNGWALDTATTPTIFSTTNEPTVSSTINTEHVTTASSTKQDDRFGKLLRDVTSTEPAQDLSTVTDTIVEKAKEIMEGMNATTTQKLMNVMKKTKSNSVKRLILLLVQTCDDDHNSTAEASKKALLEALMAVSPKDMDEIAKEEESTEEPSTVPDIDVIKTTELQRRMDRIPAQGRRGKSLNIDIEAINSLSNPTTTESLKTEETTEFTTITSIKTTPVSRRGGRKFLPKTTEFEETRTTNANQPIAEARIATQSDSKIQSDTRALELLRSLYTIAARWG